MNISLGSTVAFICNVDIDSSYDVTEAVEVSWSGPRMGRSRDGFVTTQSGSGLSYVSVLAILEVTEEDEGEYTCHLSIAGGNHQHIVLSSPTSSMITLGLGMFVLCRGDFCDFEDTAMYYTKRKIYNS